MSAEAATVGVTGGTGKTVKTDIPARLDRLPWSRWHWLVVIALGITWILDGLEVTLVGSIAGAPDLEGHARPYRPRRRPRPGASTSRAPSVGALFFGYLTDRFGRRKLFMITLGIYLIFTVATAFAWSFWSFMLFRILAGAGIGGEYSAINSAIDELVPARVRGRVALAINSSWWIGTAVGRRADGRSAQRACPGDRLAGRVRPRRDPRDRDPLHPRISSRRARAGC